MAQCKTAKNVDGLVQDCSNSIANALKLQQYCTKPRMCGILKWNIWPCRSWRWWWNKRVCRLKLNRPPRPTSSQRCSKPLSPTWTLSNRRHSRPWLALLPWKASRMVSRTPRCSATTPWSHSPHLPWSSTVAAAQEPSVWRRQQRCWDEPLEEKLHHWSYSQSSQYISCLLHQGKQYLFLLWRSAIRVRRSSSHSFQPLVRAFLFYSSWLWKTVHDLPHRGPLVWGHQSEVVSLRSSTIKMRTVQFPESSFTCALDPREPLFTPQDPTGGSCNTLLPLPCAYIMVP